MSHTFPAQGQTVDRAHVIAGEHADSNGTYVALTRAREHTHLYASTERLDADDEHGGGRENRLARLAERLGRSEPEIPSPSRSLTSRRSSTSTPGRASRRPAPTTMTTVARGPGVRCQSANDARPAARPA